MKPFMDDQSFLLTTATAERLYHDVAAELPIVDYHCHISPAEVWEDRRYENLTQVWLGGDHYKWRLMRANGVDERFITGDASDREKFQEWAETLERCIGNPVYQWAHLELKRYFGYDKPLTGASAQEVWNLAKERLAEPDMSCRGLIERSGVKLLCTTDDPADDLRYHQLLAADPSFSVKVLPACRPDGALRIERSGEFGAYVARVSAASGRTIGSFADFTAALHDRYDFFDQMGCRTADHAFESVDWTEADPAEVERVFAAGLAGEPLSGHEVLQYQSAFMAWASREYAERGWVMQLHFGCRRDNNRPMFERLGPDTGYDCIDAPTSTSGLARFLGALQQAGTLPKTVLYSLNPNDNVLIDTVMACFQEAPCAGKLQNGSAWWFNDSETGMRAQMTALAEEGVLGNFIGMLTDSRSFLSYPRHEYFRRVLCSLIGEQVEAGAYPDDPEALARLVRDISYNNAVRYFGFPLKEA